MPETETWEQPEWGAPDFTDPADVPSIPALFEQPDFTSLVSGRKLYRVTVVHGNDRTLRSDAAASYLRMIAAGMPTGGIDVYQRTKAEQEWLYDHQPPRAAPYSPDAPHIDNRGLDFQTTRNGKYTPSAAFLWITHGTDGSKAPRYTDDAGMRGHEYGWYRSVPSERWHLEYDRSRDKHRAADLKARLKALGYPTVKAFQEAHGLTADGVDGPLTWGALLNGPIPATPPKEQPVPEQPVAADFRAAIFNAQLQRFGGGPDGADAAFVKDVLRASVLACQEVDEDARNAICAATGMKVWAYKTLGLFWSPSKYSHGGRIELDLGTPYHGMIGTQLTSRKNGQSFVAASVHIRANAALKGSAEQKLAAKRADIAQVIAKLSKWSRVAVGGDWSTNARKQMEAAGYRLATPYVDTYDKDGDQYLDGMYVRGLVIRGGSEHPTKASDHDGLVASLTLPAPTPTN